MRKPKLEDFYDVNDPRGCSSSEYDNYIKALQLYNNGSVSNIEYLSVEEIIKKYPLTKEEKINLRKLIENEKQT